MLPDPDQFVVFEPLTCAMGVLEGVVCYHANNEPGPSDCVWIMPGTLDPEHRIFDNLPE